MRYAPSQPSGADSLTLAKMYSSQRDCDESSYRSNQILAHRGVLNADCATRPLLKANCDSHGVLLPRLA